MDLPTSSQASSHFPLEPVSAGILADNEVQRRNEARAFGLVRSGCDELDGYVFLGGLERGGVVGLSAEEESFGLLVSKDVFMTPPSIIFHLLCLPWPERRVA